MQWHERLAAWVRAEDRSVPELARDAGLDKETVYKWLQGKVKNPRNDGDLDRLLSVIGRNRIELFFDAAALGDSYTKEVPLLLLKRLKSLAPGQDPRSAWDGATTAQVPASVSTDAYAIRLDDEDGILGDPRNDHEFRAGDVVIVEPDTPLIPGKFVFAVAEKLGAVLFGHYRPAEVGTPTTFAIRVPNPDYPDVIISPANPGFVIGRATKLIRDL